MEKIVHYDEKFYNRCNTDKKVSYKLLLQQRMQFDDREKIEKLNVIQPVAVAVITNRNRSKVLVVNKDYRDLLFVGGHINEIDKTDNIKQTFRNSLIRELKEELGVNLKPLNEEPFIIFTPDDSERSKKHVGICYIVEVDFRKIEFKFSDEHDIEKCRVMKIDDILKWEGYEAWSKVILQQVFEVYDNIFDENILQELLYYS